MPHVLDHVSIMVSDLDQSGPFYDAVLGALGIPRLWRREDRIRYGERGAPGETYVSIVEDPGIPAGDAGHWAFRAPDRAAVDAFHAAGLAHGGSDDGPPGLRPQYHEHYYGAFLLDPDGNRVEAVWHGPLAGQVGP
jgi:catechol 2,3-dioxygenase-like lactoylglutathione lyase family enzyme